MKRLFVASIISLVLGFSIFVGNVHADGDWRWANVEMQININEDSSVDVSETHTYYFDGSFEYVYRAITLYDALNEQSCLQDSTLQCGGLDRISIIGLYDKDGNEIDNQQYETNIIDEGGNQYLNIVLKFGDGPQDFSNEYYTYTIKYTVYGSIQYDQSSDAMLFYWNALPQSEGSYSALDWVRVRMTLPEKYVHDANNFVIVQDNQAYSIKYNSQYFEDTKQYNIEALSFPTDANMTLALLINKDAVFQPANLKIINSDPQFPDVKIGQTTIKGDEHQGLIEGVPVGKQELEFDAHGYLGKNMNVEFAAGETKEIAVALEPTFFHQLMILLNYFSFGASIIALPIAIYMVINHWRKKGMDEKKIRTIIPYFKNPENIPPYLVGSIKDERVDLVDITATIIDLAYRKYIKIRELAGTSILGIQIGSKDYELLKLKDFVDLNENEKLIIESIFADKDRVTTSSLAHRFASKLPKINEAIYKEMHTRGYFSKRPDHVRRDYIGIGSLLMVFGGVAIAMAFVVIPIFFYPVFLYPGIDLVLIGMLVSGIAPVMPAKTLHGSKVYEQLLGFKMYLHTAERFRLQDQKPETFEKFLAFAMVFGVEKEWAERFKDIYKNSPDWFESSRNSFNSLYLVNSLNSFSVAAAQAFAPVNSGGGSTGSSFRGSGWSGGGGFSGTFSGGGGGGGRVGVG